MSNPLEDVLTEAISAGLASPADADRWVEAWHVAGKENAAWARALHEHMGLTRKQYAAWVADPAAWPTAGGSRS